MRTYALLTAVCLLILPGLVQAQKLLSSQDPPGSIHESLERESLAAQERGLDWLASKQNDDGSWSNPRFPALTALAMQAFLPAATPEHSRVVDKAVKFIKSCAREDGGIYVNVQGRKGGGLSNYNTAICMTALHKVGDKSLTPIILRARDFIAGSQHLGDDEYKGGFGYDRSTGRAYTDLLNTYYAVTAMRETQDVEDSRPVNEERARIDWSETVKYISRLQNKPESGEDSGGFAYNPSDPKAGTSTNEKGVVYFRSYGSITYAGLLALIYADVSRDDTRVRSAFDWASKHWTLSENPGMGDQGLYFFYNVLAKSLSTYGADLVPVPDGKPVNWRSDLAKELVSRQKTDPETGHGYWVNDTGRFWESDPVLVTAYSILALKRL